MVFNEIFTLHDLQHCSEDQCIDSVYPQSGHSGRVFLTPLSGDLLDVKEVISCAVIPSFTSRWEQTLNVIQVHFNLTERFSRMSFDFRILKEVQFISL